MVGVAEERYEHHGTLPSVQQPSPVSETLKEGKRPRIAPPERLYAPRSPLSGTRADATKYSQWLVSGS